MGWCESPKIYWRNQERARAQLVEDGFLGDFGRAFCEGHDGCDGVLPMAGIGFVDGVGHGELKFLNLFSGSLKLSVMVVFRLPPSRFPSPFPAYYVGPEKRKR